VCIVSDFARVRRKLQVVLASGLAVLVSTLCQAQAAPSSTSHLDSPISGFWEVHPDSLNAPPAAVTAEAVLKKVDVYKNDQYARRWCNAFGMPEIMYSYRPVDIRVSTTQVVIPSEFVPVPRHIYLDHQGHNNPDIYEPTPYGDSIGHWEGDDLIVETTGFSETGVRELPGGGYRTANSSLAERFHSMNEGKNLLVTSTWYDPTVFTKPYTYSIYYYRREHLPGTLPYSAGELTCDPLAPTREHLLTEPQPVSLTTAARLATPPSHSAKD
jgi:hypothetical protein